MTTAELTTRGSDFRGALRGIDLLGSTLPIAALAIAYISLGVLNPNAFSYLGLDLILGSAVPVALATMSQAFIIAIGDLDLGVGFFVGLANAIVAVVLTDSPLVALLLMVLMVAGHAAQGALISARRIPSITLTLGASFVWLGFARLIAPTPRAGSPEWLRGFFAMDTPVVPLGVWLLAGTALVGYLILFRTRIGLTIRSVGSNQDAFVANGGSMVKARMYGYALAGVFGILAGFAVTGITGSADPLASADYTLISIAAVILGGGSFFGGKASALGSVAGAMVFSVLAALMTTMAIASSYQTAAMGLGLVIVIAGRRYLSRRAT